MNLRAARRSGALALLLALVVTSSAFAVAKDEYTSTSDCNTANTQWTITTTCKKTIGTASPKRLQSGIQYSPVSAGPPTVTITDQLGNPINLGGVILVMEPSAPDAAEAEGTYGTLSSDHAWAGFRSNVDIQDPEEAGERVFIVTYSWPTPVSPDGASWFSSTMDESGDGSTVVDAYILIPGAVPADGRTWGEVKKFYRN